MDEEGDDQLALQACASCRRQKRRCDKKLPSCSLCSRLGRHCDYSVDSLANNPPSAEDFSALRQQIAELQDLIVSQGNRNAAVDFTPTRDDEGSITNVNAPSRQRNKFLFPTDLNGPSSFPSMFFLDSQLCNYQFPNLVVRPPHIADVPAAALQFLGSAKDLRSMVEDYFSTTHIYFPVISKIRLYQHLADPLHQPDATLVLLFLAMKLVCHRLAEGESPATLLYYDIKAFCQAVEAQNGLSIQSIQALQLIALYEIGHGIYPAAYLTIGNVARVGYATGLHEKQAPQLLPPPATWTEQEERRRLWWGVVILDRFVNVGNRGKPFATMDPGIDSRLPTNDEAWDRGEMLIAAPLSLSASPTVAASPFARTCQAAYLLGKTLRHIDDSSMPMDYRFDEALQLARTIRAFAEVLVQDSNPDEAFSSPPGPLATSLGIIYSALLTLYDNYSCTESFRNAGGGEAQLQMQKESIEGLREASGRVLGFGQRLRIGIESGDSDRMSPMVVDAIYQAAANYAWYVRESSDAVYRERLLELEELLLLLDGRWRVAGEYYRIVQLWQSSPVASST